jgi:hypothetical protein
MYELIQELEQSLDLCETVEMNQSIIDWIIENSLTYNMEGTLHI